MPLGELLGEASGKGAVTKVEAPEGAPPKVQIACQGQGTLLGMDMQDFGSYWQQVTPGGRLLASPPVDWVMVTADGDMAVWRGFGTGHVTGAGSRYAGCGWMSTDSPKLARLDTISTVAEFAADNEGNYRWKLWEFLPEE
jgi:hypothetical protein